MSKRELTILHTNGAVRILHHLAGCGETGAHRSEIGRSVNLSGGTVSAYLSALRHGHFNPGVSSLLHRNGLAYKGEDFRPLVENARGTGMYRLSDDGRQLLSKVRFGWDWR